MSPFLIGQAPDHPCPVCELSPVGLRAVETLPGIAECVRCGFFYVTHNEEGETLPKAIPATSASLFPIFRRYHQETGKRCGLMALPEKVEEASIDPEIRVRTGEMDAWLRERPHLLTAANAGSGWPYATVVALRIEMDGRAAWHVLAPPSSVGIQVMVPVSPEGLPNGSIVTISVPVDEMERQQPAADSDHGGDLPQ